MTASCPGRACHRSKQGVLAVFAIITAVAAFLAFRNQSQELEDQRHVNAEPPRVHRLHAQELRASLDVWQQAFSRWYDYSRARDAMLAATDTAWAPWYIAHTDDKKRGRLNIISHLLSQIPYEPLARREVMLPKRQRAGGYVEPDLSLRYIPTPF